MKLFELYQEAKRSSFTHDGQDYNINIVLKAVDNHPIKDFLVSDLKWVLKHTTVDTDRVAKADKTKPILVTALDDRLVAIDGAHRLTKAVEDGDETLPGKYVSKKILNTAKL